MSEITKLQDSAKHWKTKAQEKTAEIRFLKKQISQTRASRDQWRHKSIKNSYLRREISKKEKRQELKIAKIQEKNANLKSQNILLTNENHKLKTEISIQIDSPMKLAKTEVILIAITLFVSARISYRGLSRVLHILGKRLGILFPPSPQTIINWVNKLSLVRMAETLPKIPTNLIATAFTNGWIYILDESIGQSGGKILAVLAVKIAHYSASLGVGHRHPTFKDICCIASSVSESWTGEKIAELLERVILALGKPVAYLKDGGTNLEKALKLLEGKNLGSPTISDISHIAANLLKSIYGVDSRLADFLSTCGQVAKNLKQTALGCLAPPAIRTKARFMNLHSIFSWASRILGLSPVGRAPSESLLQQLRDGLGTLKSHKAFIAEFLRDAETALAFQEVLKNKGLNKETAGECEQILKASSANHILVNGLTQWLNHSMDIVEKLLPPNVGMLVSSDIIESTFGLAKSHGTGYVKDPNRIALRIPALCGLPTKLEAHSVSRMPQADLALIEAEISSLHRARVNLFNGSMKLEDLRSESYSNLSLCRKADKPGIKKQPENPGSIDQMTDCDQIPLNKETSPAREEHLENLRVCHAA